MEKEPLKENTSMRHVYAIIRSDDFLTDSEISNRVTIIRIVWTRERAEKEVTRLNQVNADKECHYFWQLTRLESER